MSMGGGRRTLNSEINVTPMLDVLLVLLIVFMVTAPMLQTGVDLELPQAEAAVIGDEEGKLILSIDKAGRLFLGQTEVKWEELEVKLATNAKVKADSEVYIEADKNLPYGTVLQAMAVARKAGVRKLMMMTDPLDTSAAPSGVAPGGAAPGGSAPGGASGGRAP
jgi:biopolymer transport protein TolR